MKQSKKGFTLVEIMIVVAIIGILAAIAIPNFVRYRKQAQANACIGNLKQIQSATEQYLMANGEKSEQLTLDAICGSTLYLKSKPVCPSKGTYTLGGSEENIPTCSFAATAGSEYAHALPAAN